MKKIWFFVSIIFILIFGFFVFEQESFAQNTTTPCRVKEAFFEPNGRMPKNWYSDTNKPIIKIYINTDGCRGRNLDFSIIEDDWGIGNDDAVGIFDNFDIKVPSSSDIVEFTMKAGEDECEINTDPDCNYFYIEIKGDVFENYSSENKPKGKLLYDCDTICDEGFEYVDVNFGDFKVEYYFFGNSINDTMGPFENYSSCKAAYDLFKTTNNKEPNGSCFFKLIRVNSAPPTTTTTPNQNQQGDGVRDYELLAPIPGLVPNNVVTSDFKLGTFVNNLIKVVIGIAAVLAVLMIVIGGIQWMMSDSLIQKNDGRSRIQNALFGLLIALGCYLILITINPNLTNLDFRVDKQIIKIQEIQDDGSSLEISYPNKIGTCPMDCVDLLPDVPIKNSSGKKVEKEFKGKLSELSKKLSSESTIQDKWGTTEAWQPSRVHKAECHQRGTCIDANFNGITATPATVKIFISKAKEAGLCAVYEVKTEQDLNSMIQGGVPRANIKNFGDWISAPHFSIYGGSC